MKIDENNIPEQQDGHEEPSATAPAQEPTPPSAAGAEAVPVPLSAPEPEPALPSIPQTEIPVGEDMPEMPVSYGQPQPPAPLPEEAAPPAPIAQSQPAPVPVGQASYAPAASVQQPYSTPYNAPYGSPYGAPAQAMPPEAAYAPQFASAPQRDENWKKMDSSDPESGLSKPEMVAPAPANNGKYATKGQMLGSIAATAVIVAGLCFGINAIGAANPPSNSAGNPAPVNIASVDTDAADIAPTLANQVADKALPSVVSVYTYQAVNNFYNMSDPFSMFYGNPGRSPQQGQNQGQSQPDVQEQLAGMGSGVIISEDGYIITNQHVVSGASSLKVKVGDEEYAATLIGEDPQSDIAVIKLDPAADQSDKFVPIDLADSSKLRIGDWVMAIGAPYGYTSTVTTGIISALGRSTAVSSMTGQTLYANMIQTDASINTGNSGGALVDARGALVGINTMIASTSGADSGINFAIPSNYAMNIANQLIEGKSVKHAQLGVNLVQDASIQGGKIDAVNPGSAAEAAGLKKDDIIVKIGDKKINSASEVIYEVRGHMVDDEIDVTYTRDGKEETIKLKLGSD